MPTTDIVYILHGRDSSPEGKKIVMLQEIAREAGWKTIIPDQSRIKNPSDRVADFGSFVEEQHGRVILVGSSMGGYVATVTSEKIRPDALFLLSPAFYQPGYPEIDPVPNAAKTVVVHGWNDTVVPAACSVRFADKHKTELHLLDDDHRLYDSLDFIRDMFLRLLESCGQMTWHSRISTVI